jgi:cob(I)alamin adenosyltransferase
VNLLTDYFRKRKLRAEIRRIQSDVVYVLSKVQFTEQEKKLFLAQAKKSIEALELQIREVEHSLTVNKL